MTADLSARYCVGIYLMLGSSNTGTQPSGGAQVSVGSRITATDGYRFDVGPSAVRLSCAPVEAPLRCRMNVGLMSTWDVFLSGFKPRWIYRCTHSLHVYVEIVLCY